MVSRYLVCSTHHDDRNVCVVLRGDHQDLGVFRHLFTEKKENYTTAIIKASIAIIMITMVLITTMNITITWALG